MYLSAWFCLHIPYCSCTQTAWGKVHAYHHILKMTTTYPLPILRAYEKEAVYWLCLGIILLFFIHLSAMVWPTPKVRARPREEVRSCAARTTISLNSSDFLLLSNTTPKPQDLHLYLRLLTRFEPFFTIWSEPHFTQHFFSITMILVFRCKAQNHTLRYNTNFHGKF